MYSHQSAATTEYNTNTEHKIIMQKSNYKLQNESTIDNKGKMVKLSLTASTKFII